MTKFDVVLENNDYIPDDVFEDILSELFYVPDDQIGEHIVGLKNLGSLKIAHLSFQIAEQKAFEIITLSRQFGVDLTCRLEPVN